MTNEPKTPTIYRLGYGTDKLTRADAEAFAAVGDGWKNTLIKFLLDHIDQFYTEFHIGQIKEKFGGLRFYVFGGTYREGVEHHVGYGSTGDYIEAVEFLSLYICEECGAPGSRTENGGWIKTLCPRCEKSDQK